VYPQQVRNDSTTKCKKKEVKKKKDKKSTKRKIMRSNQRHKPKVDPKLDINYKKSIQIYLKGNIQVLRTNTPKLRTKLL